MVVPVSRPAVGRSSLQGRREGQGVGRHDLLLVGRWEEVGALLLLLDTGPAK